MTTGNGKQSYKRAYYEFEHCVKYLVQIFYIKRNVSTSLGKKSSFLKALKGGTLKPRLHNKTE